jgi:imidazolonepropionase-like amidohydrolase
MTRLALSGARLLDGNRPAVENATVVIDGHHVAEVGTDAPAAPVDRTVDLRGATVLPGMFTCHFHATYHELGSQPNTPYGDEYPPSYLALIAARNLHTALRHGFTGVVGAGGSHDVEGGVRRAIDDGLIPGPRFWASSRELSTTGHSNDAVPWHWGMRASGAVHLCDGAEGFRLGVREEIKRGAQVVKLFVTGGHGTTAPKDRIEISRAELAAAIETAHERGALIRGHLVNKPAILMALELGIDIVDHCDAMDDEIIAALVETGATVVPSLHFPKHFVETFGSGLGFAAGAMRADLERMCAVIPEAQAAGVRFVLGDDYGAIGFPHGMYGAELRLYVERAGVTPLDVIGWATRNGAEMVGRSDDLGTIAVGKLADLIVVDGDPSVDIGVLADHPPRAVIKGGELVAGTLAFSDPDGNGWLLQEVKQRTPGR